MGEDPLKHQRLLGSIVAKYLGRGLCEEDLRAEGQIGLLRACEGYDPALGNSFTTYATPWIHRTISRAIDNQVSLIRVPAHVRELIRYKDSARPGGTKLIAAGKQALRRHVNERTLESRSEGFNLASIAFDYRGDPVAEPVASAELATLMQALNPREAEIIRMRYGIGADGEMTQLEVGTKLGRTKQRISQIEAKAMAKLRAVAGVEPRRDAA